MGYVRFLITATLLALMALTSSAQADDTDALIRALIEDPSHKVRVKAAQKLAGFKLDRARDALLAALDDENPLVRAAVAHALRRQPHAASVAGLCGLIGDADDFVRRTATRSLDALGGARGCPAVITLEVTGDTPEMQAHLTTALRKQLDDDVAIRVVEEVPPAVMDGRQRGYELKLSLSRKIERTAAETQVSCAVTQAIFDLEKRSLRGSATQRGALSLGPETPDAIVTRQLEACMDALVPVLHRGMSDFLARSRR